MIAEHEALECLRHLRNWLRSPGENTPAEWDNITDARDVIAQYLRDGGKLSPQAQADLARADSIFEEFAPTILDAMKLTNRNLPPEDWALEFRRRHTESD